MARKVVEGVADLEIRALPGDAKHHILELQPCNYGFSSPPIDHGVVTDSDTASTTGVQPKNS